MKLSRMKKDLAAALALAAVLGSGSAATLAADGSNSSRSGQNQGGGRNDRETATPIKHVIVIVGENRSFDHLFATYTPKRKGESVKNLLSEGIVNADGSRGPNFARAHQFQIVAPPNGGKFFSNANAAQKQLYPTLPSPDVAGVGAVSPYAGISSLPGGDPGLPPADQFLFATGGTGLPFTLGPDTRITNVNALPPGPFQLTGPNMPFDAFAGDTIHQFFQMVQQVDCKIDAEHVSRGNPTGCLHDLQSAVTTTFNTPPGGVPHDTGQTMAFFNMQQGDAPFFKFLADAYTIGDNYHQPVHGGTGPDSLPLGFADQVFFSDGNGNPVAPPASTIYNPDPRSRGPSTRTRSARSSSIARTARSRVSPRSPIISNRCHTPSTPSAALASSTRPSTSIPHSRRRGCPRPGSSCRPLSSGASAMCSAKGELPGHGRGAHARRDRSLRRPGQRHPAGGILREAGRHHGRPPCVVEVVALRGLRGEHRRADAGESEAVGGDGHPHHRRRGRRLLRFGLHPAGRLFRHRAAHPHRRGLALLQGRPPSATLTTSTPRW